MGAACKAWEALARGAFHERHVTGGSRDPFDVRSQAPPCPQNAS